MIWLRVFVAATWLFVLWKASTYLFARVGDTVAAVLVAIALVLIVWLQRSLKPFRQPPPPQDWATADTSPLARVWRGHPMALFETHAEACARREQMPDSAAWTRATED